MSTAPACCLPAPIALHRPWWRRAWDALTERRRAARAAEADADERALYRALGHLSDHTLRDIGAPAWLREGDPARELRRLERERW